MAEIISKIIPILLLITLGYMMQYKSILKQTTIDEVKKVVINLSLPSVLFVTYINMELKIEYLIMFIVIFIMSIVFYYTGVLLNKINILAHPIIPFMVSGCSFGLLGVPLYATVFGIENLDKISILGIGHEAFMWFFYVTILKMTFRKEKFSLETIKGFLTSPLILSIVLGLFFNISGFNIWFNDYVVLKGIYITIQYLGNLATPLILIIIGFGLKFSRRYMKLSVKFVALRLAVILTIGYLFKGLLIDRMITPEPLFNYAYFTFLILPPAFSSSIFIGEYSSIEHKELANNTVVLSTAVCIIIFICTVFMVGV